MTSFVIDSFARRAEQIKDHLSSSGASGEGKWPTSAECTFCNIVSRTGDAFVVHEDDVAMALLDIYFIRRGHLLVISKAHHPRITDLPSETSAHMASLLPPLARALASALSNPDMSVVCNVGYAQVVDHVHWHIVPAPTLPSSSSGRKEQSGWGGLSLLGEAMGRTELDEADGRQLAETIRGALRRESMPR